MEEKNRETSVMEEDLPDTAAFEIMDVLPEEEPERKTQDLSGGSGKGNRKWIIAAGILVLLALIWFLIR